MFLKREILGGSAGRGKPVRYIRVSRGGASLNCFAELQAFSGGVNVALNKPVFLSNRNTNCEGRNAALMENMYTDGIRGTGFDAYQLIYSGLYIYLQVDLGQEYNIEQLVEYQGNYGSYSTSKVIQIAGENGQWETVFSGSDTPDNIGGHIINLS